MQRVGFLSAFIISNPQTELKPVLFSACLYILQNSSGAIKIQPLRLIY